MSQQQYNSKKQRRKTIIDDDSHKGEIRHTKLSTNIIET